MAARPARRAPDRAFALLSARVSKRIDDDYPEFTDALLDVLYPHHLRPFPACSIAYFDMDGVASKLSAPVADSAWHFLAESRSSRRPL